MSEILCVVSGTVAAPAGSRLSEATVTFLPAPVAARSHGQQIIMPQPVSVTPDAAGQIQVELVPGVYSVRTRQESGLEYDAYLVEVPAADAAHLSEIRLHLPSPLSVYDAAASAHRAALAAGDAETALAQINGVGGIDLEALSQLVAEVRGLLPEDGTDGDVLTLSEGTPAWRSAPQGGVTSVNGQTGAVVLGASQIGAATAAQGALADTALQPGSPVPWSDVVGQPAEFPPAAHGHGLAEIAGLQAALDGRAPLIHGHTVAQISDFPALAPVATSGAYADLSGTPGVFAGTTAGLVPVPVAGTADRFLRADGSWVEPPGGGGGGSIAWTDVTGKPAAFPPEAHGHTVAQISDFPALGSAAALNVGAGPGTVAAGDHGHAAATGAVAGFLSAADKTKLDGIAAGAQPGTVTSVGITGANGITVSGAPVTAAGAIGLGLTFGTAANTVTQGNDSRLSNSREWTAATVDQAEAEAGTATTRRAWTAQRVRQSVTAWAGTAFKTIGGQSILGSGDISVGAGSVGWEDITGRPTAFLPAPHTHSVAQITDFPTLGGAAVLNVGTTAGTVAAGNDARLADARDWTAETIPQAEAEAGTATTRRAWTAQRVRQAVAAWWETVQVATARIADAAVTNAKLASMAAQTVKVRNATTAGAPSDLALADNAVLGRSGTGNVASLAAGGNGVLRRDGTGALAFGTLALGNLDAAAQNALRDRATHTGTQAIGTVTGLQAALDGKLNVSAMPAFEFDWLGEGDQTLLSATTTLQGRVDTALAGVFNLTNDFTTAQLTTPLFDAGLMLSSSRPGVGGRRVIWPVSVMPNAAVDAGVLTPALSGPPPNAGPNDAFDAVPDSFDVMLTGNLSLASMTKAGGAALDATDRFRTGVIVFQQDTTGGRTITLAGGSHYTLVGRDLGDGNTLPIGTAPNAVTTVYFTVISPTRVDLVVALPGAN